VMLSQDLLKSTMALLARTLRITMVESQVFKVRPQRNKQMA